MARNYISASRGFSWFTNWRNAKFFKPKKFFFMNVSRTSPLLRCQKYVSHFQISIFGQRQGDILAIIFDFTNFFSHLSELYTSRYDGPLLKKELEKNLFYWLIICIIIYSTCFVWNLGYFKNHTVWGFSCGFVHCGG